ncbi:MAG: hypothetical protein JRG86_10845 [Deltaproteobacteria bacterium]|jgi:hypothetical protein|nr:hypothetical protein [Deltaproteobacteria bacterium]
MSRASLQPYWQAVRWLVLVIGLCWALILADRARLGSSQSGEPDSASPAVSSAPPLPSVPSDAKMKMAAFAEVDGRVYRIVLGSSVDPDVGTVPWSAAISTEEGPGAEPEASTR